jgi:hypothetical protein
MVQVEVGDSFLMAFGCRRWILSMIFAEGPWVEVYQARFGAHRFPAEIRAVQPVN